MIQDARYRIQDKKQSCITYRVSRIGSSRTSCIMKNDGITLIELIVAIAVVGILVGALAFEFQGWMGSYRVESQIKEMYVDLLNARTRAMQTNRCHFVVIAVDNYQIFEDANENCTYNAGTDTALAAFTNPKPLTYPVDSSSWIGTVTMDIKGIVSPNNSIFIDIGSNNPDYDCIVLFETRINIGKWNGSCVAK